MLFSDLSMRQCTAGVDEVGRGPLAGPVVAAAVILRPNAWPVGLKDSKRLTARRREVLAQEIRAQAWCWALGRAEVTEIDDLNILRASHLAMQRAVAGLSLRPEFLLVDGNRLPSFAIPAVAVIKGDDRVPEISAASIIAKVARDAEMVRAALDYPGYGLEKHKGYPTAEHLAALRRLGPCPLHRCSFAPIREAVAREAVRKAVRKAQAVLV
jgi:ribonuclease HII